MKVFVLGIPHTQTTTEFTTCAFTMKVWNLCRMLTRRGHHVVHLGTEGSNPECTEHVSVVPKELWQMLYGHPGTNFYNLETTGKYRPYHAMWASNAHKAIKDRCQKDYEAILAMTWGGTQREATTGIKQFEVESGIGYACSWADYRVYESYAWLHMHLGRDNQFAGAKWYHTVIPNAFDPAMFDWKPKGQRGDDFLFIGRLNDDKGVGLAIHVAKEVGRNITIVGQGSPDRFLVGNPHVRYMPPVGIEGRKKLMAEARAVFCPTFYVDPFCGVNVEAQMSGAPIICTDWGVFPETVLHGITGYRCRNFEQFVWAAKNIDTIDPANCRQWAVDNYSLDRVSLMYEEFFQSVLNIQHKAGFYLPHPDRKSLNWMRKCWPTACSTAIDTKELLIVPPQPPPEVKKDEWTEAQDWERGWWGLTWAPHWDEELKKQESYFRLIGFPSDKDFGSKTILDVGCGPVSVLQRSKHGPARGVDPLAVTDETRLRYTNANCEFLNIKAEEMPVDKVFDETWMYNCLQHTQNPMLILEKIAAMSNVVRIFEWIDLGVCPGHPQNLTEDMFWKTFGNEAWLRPIWNTGQLRDFGGTVTNKYIAIEAHRVTPITTVQL